MSLPTESPIAPDPVPSISDDHTTLHKPLGALQIWALGVGAVITGEYFGWNGGLGAAGPLGMLIATVFVCVLYLLWVMALLELSVAMPFAGGPLAYGRRAVGPWLGFVMGWSMFLECLFAAIGTAIATGGYLYFLLSLLFEGLPKELTTTIAALLTVALFGGLQFWGARQQAKIMEWMTYGAIVGLVWFWIAAWPGVKIERIFTDPLLPFGWFGVVKAIPFAIWWLVIIESVALAAEEAHEPHHSLPRGLLLAQLTLIVLVVLTWFFACAAGEDWRRTGDGVNNLYPLATVYREVWPGPQHRPHMLGFSLIALCGMVASYNGMLFAVSRQSYSLGRAGYLPGFLGLLHRSRRTPYVSIVVWSGVIAGFAARSYFNPKAVEVSVLTCNLAALVWYVLAMVCLVLLRIREPHMPRPYRVPLFPLVPFAVIAMSLLAAVVYGWMQEPIVLWLTLVMYLLGFAWYFGWARTRLVRAAPEEASARAAGRP
ncbi:MAG: amino acid permease [Planctomycetaceae bacterium]|nr:MAG: amino acid permease [Planctomycetaceae bacterium]